MHWKRQHGTPERYCITCAWCGTKHKTPRKNGRFCSRTCYGAMRSYEAGTNLCKLPKGHPGLVPIKAEWPSCRIFLTTCAVCGELFTTRYTVSTCGPACKEIKRQDDKRESKHRRRALQRNAFVAPVSPRRVFERDRWRCHICGKRTRKTVAVPHPMAPTLDHLVPLAVGGTHEPANVRTAHFLCNSMKNARGGGEQLMLIG